MKRIYSGIAAFSVALVLAGCSATDDGAKTSERKAVPADQLQTLRAGIDSGTECPDLFPLLKAIPADTPSSEQAQAEMRNIGCFSRSSERTDAERSVVDPDSEWIGVPGGQRVTVSARCSEASVLAAREIDSEAAEVLIEGTLEICSTVNEWMSALEDHPGVMGMVDGYIPSSTDIQVACINYPESKVCADAKKLGL